MKTVQNCVIAVLACAIFCCAQTKPSGEDPNPSQPQAGASVPAYVIGPRDVLSIKVKDEPNLSGNATVGADGTISIPRLGEIQAAGFTRQQLTEAIAERLAKAEISPDVRVQLLRSNRIQPKPFFVPGQR